MQIDAKEMENNFNDNAMPWARNLANSHWTLNSNLVNSLCLIIQPTNQPNFRNTTTAISLSVCHAGRID
jgi:hypothetical protein